MASAAAPKTLTGRRFLVVDDKAFIRAVVRSMLLRAGAAEVIEAASGVQARVELTARGADIDCIICDWSMQPVSGLDVLQSLRCGAIAGVTRGLCFVMLTGHGAEGVVKAAIDLDVNAYLVKPPCYEKLVRIVAQALDQRIALRTDSADQAVTVTAVPDAIRAAETGAAGWIRPPAQVQFKDRIAEIRRELLHRSMSGIMNSRRAPITAVEPGQVLAEDLFADADVLLAPAGTVITPDLLAYFRAFAADGADEAHLWVGDALPSPRVSALNTND